MKIAVCDKCGVVGRANKHEEGPRVVEVKAGLPNGGRILDLCGDCRRAFHALIDGWLDKRCGVCGHPVDRHSAGGMCAGEPPDGSECHGISSAASARPSPVFSNMSGHSS